MVLLEVEGEDDLYGWADACSGWTPDGIRVPHAVFFEPDIGNEMTAIAFLPGDPAIAFLPGDHFLGRLRKLPLAMRKSLDLSTEEVSSVTKAR